MADLFSGSQETVPEGYREQSEGLCEESAGFSEPDAAIAADS
jgi:hypothetical protein